MCWHDALWLKGQGYPLAPNSAKLTTADTIRNPD